ncbi:MAG TPA: nucleolar RNA-binding Nop10p family protein [Acidobacteriota bacterium]|nr:nucleolar RNA-binding Nop10p family protein [Acidobacteriota bacterium]
MSKEILVDAKTGEYTFKLKSKDGTVNASNAPQKYSPIDKYGDYRRKAKEQQKE